MKDQEVLCLLLNVLFLVHISIGQSNLCPNNLGTQKICINQTAVGTCIQGELKSVMACQQPTPYCDDSKNCGRDPAFICPPDKSGYFPDLNQCNKYHFCLNGKSTTITCTTPNTIYDPNLRSCASFFRRTCHHFNCRGKNGKFVAYPGDPTIYAMCTQNHATSIDKCPGKLAYNNEFQECRVECLTEGNLEDPDSCMKFFECMKFGNRFVREQKTCPDGTWFNPELRYCEIDEEMMCREGVLSSASQTTAMPV